MKKSLAVILAVLTVFSCMVFATVPSSAADAEKIIPISTCDSEDGFSKSTELKGMPALDTENPKAGKGSLAFTFEGVQAGPAIAGAGFPIYMYNRPGGAYDASAMNAIVFDLYVSSAAAFKDTVFEVELRDVNYTTRPANEWDGHEKAINGTIASLGDIELVDGWNHVEISILSMTTKGTVDMTKWSYFRIFAANACGIEGETHSIKLDNLYMTSRMGGVQKLILPVPTKTFNVPAGDAIVDPGAKCTLATPVDVTGMKRLEFDFELTDPEVQKDWKFTIELTSAGEPDAEESNIDMKLSAMAALSGIELKAGVNHFSIPLASFSKGCDFTRLNFFRIFYNHGKATAATSGVFSNPVLVNSELTEGRFVIKEGVSEVINATNVNVADSGVAIQFKVDFGALGMTTVKYIECELYVDNPQLLDTNVFVEYTSAGTCDNEEISRAAVVKEHFKRVDGKDIVVGEWNTVRLDISKLNDTNTGFRPEYANYIRIFNQGAMKTDGSTVWKLKDIALVAVEEDTSSGTVSDKLPGIDYISAPNNETVPTENDPENGALVFVNTAATGYHDSISRVHGFSFAPVDASEADALYFDLYLENVEDILDATFNFEVTSSGVCDVEENCLDGVLMNIFTREDGNVLQNGWNRIRIDLEYAPWKQAGGGVDWTRVNFIRIFNTNTIVAPASKAAIDNICFASDNMMEASRYNTVEITGAALQLQETLNIVYYADVHETIENAVMTFTYQDHNGKTVTQEVEGVRTANANQRAFLCEGLLPQWMNHNISAMLVAINHDGSIMTDSVDNYSIKAYCTNMLAAIQSGNVADNEGALEALICNVLEYGAAAQTYHNYQVDNLANAGVDTSKALAPIIPNRLAGIVGEQGACKATFTKPTVALENVFMLRIAYSAADTTGVALKYYTNADATVKTAKCTLDTKTGEYVAKLPIRPYEMNMMYTFYFEGFEEYRLEYSLGTYICNVKEQYSTETDLIALLDAMTAYSRAALDYVAAQR